MMIKDNRERERKDEKIVMQKEKVLMNVRPTQPSQLNKNILILLNLKKKIRFK